MSCERVENVNPVKHFKDFFINSSMLNRGVSREELKGRIITENSRSIFIESVKSAESYFIKLQNIPIHPNLQELLTSKKKHHQEHLLKDMSFTPDSLTAYIIYAYNQYGYLFSEYVSETLPKGIKETDLPLVFNVDNNVVTTIGNTTLTDNQLKQVIQQRKVIVAKFLDNGEQWHCFFETYRSLKGEESWREGQPHLHYISDKFGLSKERAIEQIMNGNYPSTKVHIPFLEYGNQPSNH